MPTDYAPGSFGTGGLLEKEIEQRFVRGITAKGGTAYKFVSPARRSVPDRVVVMPGGRIIFVEIKTDKGVLSRGQEREITRLIELGCEVHVLYGMADTTKFLEEL